MGSRYTTPASLLWRDCNRGQLEPSLERFGCSQDVCLCNLTIHRPVPLCTSRHNRIHSLTPKRIEARTSLNARYTDRLPVTSGILEEYSDSQLGPMIRQRKDALAFRRIMIYLFRQIVQAEHLYRTFQLGYDNDVSAIEKYATWEVLNALWILKMTGRSDRRDDLGIQGFGHDSSSDRFVTMNRKVVQALEGALNPTLAESTNLSRRTATRIESAKRLQQKVDTAKEQILDLLELVPKGREYCKALLCELDLLKTLIDPQTDKNKELYLVGDSEDVEFRSDIENGKGDSGSQEQEAW